MKSQEATTTTEATKKTAVKASKAANGKPAQKGSKATKKTKPGKAVKVKYTARPGSKKDIVLKLRRREEGATLAELAKATAGKTIASEGFSAHMWSRVWGSSSNRRRWMG